VSDVTVEKNTVTMGNGGCTNSGVAVVATNSEGNTVRLNDFAGATRLVLAESGGAAGTACGNRLTGTAFNQPIFCPA
jgi:hypothetical protein